MANSRYIAIEGPIGVGKTSLARRLAAELDGELVLEEAGANPFLERFYEDPRGAALPAQLFFLFQRSRQLDQLAQADMFSEVRVADFLMAKDRLFAEITLDRDELALYEKIHSTLEYSPAGARIWWFSCRRRWTRLLFRIARRGINYEQDYRAPLP